MSKKSFVNNPAMAFVSKPQEAVEQPQTDKTEISIGRKTEAQEQPNTASQGISKRKAKYMRLDVTEYQEYLKLMAEYTAKSTGKYTSMTQYIQRLIEEDRRKNKELYDKLEQIEKLKAELQKIVSKKLIVDIKE